MGYMKTWKTEMEWWNQVELSDPTQPSDPLFRAFLSQRNNSSQQKSIKSFATSSPKLQWDCRPLIFLINSQFQCQIWACCQNKSQSINMLKPAQQGSSSERNDNRAGPPCSCRRGVQFRTAAASSSARSPSDARHSELRHVALRSVAKQMSN